MPSFCGIWRAVGWRRASKNSNLTLQAPTPQNGQTSSNNFNNNLHCHEDLEVFINSNEESPKTWSTVTEKSSQETISFKIIMLGGHNV